LQDGSTYPFMVPILQRFVLLHATPIALLVAYGEFAIGLSLVLGILVRTASAFGFVYMLALLFSSNYPGAQAALWQYFGASLNHSVLALCFLSFLFGHSESVFSLRNLSDPAGNPCSIDCSRPRPADGKTRTGDCR
jgi:thiosulfate dehydrogenase [quinone] large subunit